MTTSFAQQRLNMLEGHIRPYSVIDTRILDAYKTVPRERYLGQAQQGLAYLGGNLPMGEERFLVDPAAHARLIQGLDIGAGENPHILDIGCLYGYTTALLACLTPNVTGLDTAHWIGNVDQSNQPHAKFVAGSLTEGVQGHEPFDMIVINGAVQEVPAALRDQLKENGKLATFSRNATSQLAYAVIYHKQKGVMREQILFDAFIPSLPGFAAQQGFVF